MTSATERHAVLIDAGWRCDMHGRWISPDPHEARFTFTAAAAWRQLQHDHDTDDPDTAA